MPKIDNTIFNAIEKSVAKYGSQAALCKKTGISTSIMSRYLKREVGSINAGTWNMIFPVIKEFLPEEYHRTFLDWKTPEEWKQIKEELPGMYSHFQKTAEGFDIGKNAHSQPQYGKTGEHYLLCETIKTKLPYGHLETLNKILRLLLDDEDNAKKIEQQAKQNQE